MCTFGNDYPSCKLPWIYHGRGLAAMPSRCNRHVREWACTQGGAVLYARRRPLHDGHTYKAEEESDSTLVSVSSSPLPSVLLRFVTAALALHILASTRPAPPSSMQQLELVALGSGEITWTAKLRGDERDLQFEADTLAIEGVRNAKQSVSRLHLVAELGKKAHLAIWPLAGHPQWASKLNKLGSEEAILDETAVDIVRQALARVIGAPTVQPSGPTPIRTILLEAWQRSAAYPDKSVPKWLQHGAPVGTTLDMAHDGISPPLDNEALRCPIMQSQADEFCNYKVVEEDGYVGAEIVEYLGKGYLKAFTIAA